MARRMPSPEGNPQFSPALSLSLLVMWIAASVAILATLCASCHGKPASDPSNGSVGNKSKNHIQQQEQEEVLDGIDGEERISEFDAAIHGPIYPTMNTPAASTSRRKLSASLSTGLKEGLSKIRTKKESHGKGGGGDSLWKKTLTFGGKSKMHNSEEGGEGSNQEPKTPVSRNTSFASAETSV